MYRPFSCDNAVRGGWPRGRRYGNPRNGIYIYIYICVCVCVCVYYRYNVDTAAAGIVTSTNQIKASEKRGVYSSQTSDGRRDGRH